VEIKSKNTEIPVTRVEQKLNKIIKNGRRKGNKIKGDKSLNQGEH